VELVTLRVNVQGPIPQISNLFTRNIEASSEIKTVALAGIDGPVPVYARDSLVEKEIIPGPALITETVSTTYMASGWECVLHESGSLVLTRC